jgi:predicted PurR-regulated permease PerM
MSPDWQRSLVTMAAAVVTATVVVVLYWARSICIPIALSIFFAFVLSPVVTRLQRRGLGRSSAVLLTVFLVLVAMVGVGSVVGQQVTRLVATLPDRTEVIKAKVVAAKQWIVGDGQSRFGEMIDDISNAISPRQVGPQPIVVEKANNSLTAQLEAYIGPAAEFLGQAMFAFVLTIYILIRREDLRNRMIRLIGDGKVTHTTKAVDEATRRISRYLLVQLMVNVAFGLIVALGLFLLGVEYPLLWGFVGTLMRYVPYIGTWVGLLLPVLFSFATAPAWGGWWGQPLAVFVLYAALEVVWINVLEPWLYGHTMGLSEVAQIIAAAVWAFLWGPVGLILSGPLTACLLVLGKYVAKLNFLSILLGDEPALSPQVAFYQRLAARDQDEAAEVALAVAKEAGPDATLASVVVPALCMARRDLDEGDLDPNVFRFVVRSAREVVAEIDDLREPISSMNTEKRVRVLLVPARDEAEHVAADALAHSLDHTRWEVRVAGEELLASELIAAVDEFRPAVVVLVTLPPGGLSHCRYLVSRLRAKHPDLHVLVARWSSDGESSLTQTGIKGAEGIDHTLAETRKRLTEMHPVLTVECETAAKSTSKRNGVSVAGEPRFK